VRKVNPRTITSNTTERYGRVFNVVSFSLIRSAGDIHFLRAKNPRIL
jgi:hypothetical protein